MDQNQSQTNEASQREAWILLKNDIKNIISKVAHNNIKESAIKLFELNLYRGKGLLVREIMKQQLHFKTHRSHIYASLIAILNSMIPDIGKLITNRLILQFRKAFKNNDVKVCSSSLQLLTQLVNQKVCNEVILLQIISFLLNSPTDGTIYLSIGILNGAMKFLQINSKKASEMIFERLRVILQDGDINDKSIEAIKNLLERKNKLLTNEKITIIPTELDLTQEQETHLITLDDEELRAQDYLNVFKYDKEYDTNEIKYQEFKKDILADNVHIETVEKRVESQEKSTAEPTIVDMTDAELQKFQKIVYLTIMSSMSADEAVHKIIQLETEKQRTDRIVDMIVKCCAQEKTYSKYYGIIGERLCTQSKKWHDNFVTIFKEYYNTIHQYEMDQLRNTGRFWGHLFASDRLAIDQAWNEIKLTENHTTAASRIFIKFMFLEMVEELGVKQLHARVTEDFVKKSIRGLFPVLNVSWRDADHIRFSINYFTAIGLGSLTDEMRSVLKNLPQEERGRRRERRSSTSDSRSESGSYSRSESGSYSRSRSGSYSRSRSSSYSRSRSRSSSYSRSRSGSPNKEEDH